MNGEKKETPAQAQPGEHPTMQADIDLSKYKLFDIFFKLIVNQLEKSASKTGFLSFKDVENSIKNIQIDHNTRIEIMVQMEKLGIVKSVSLHGWIIINPAWLDTETDR